jgi:hypothetical protein
MSASTLPSASASPAADIYNDGMSLLAAQSPIEALAAFNLAASLGHPAAHAAAAAVYFEGSVARDGTVVDGNHVKAYDMCAPSVTVYIVLAHLLVCVSATMPVIAALNNHKTIHTNVPSHLKHIAIDTS